MGVNGVRLIDQGTQRGFAQSEPKNVGGLCKAGSGFQVCHCCLFLGIVFVMLLALRMDVMDEPHAEDNDTN